MFGQTLPILRSNEPVISNTCLDYDIPIVMFNELTYDKFPKPRRITGTVGYKKIFNKTVAQCHYGLLKVYSIH